MELPDYCQARKILKLAPQKYYRFWSEKLDFSKVIGRGMRRRKAQDGRDGGRERGREKQRERQREGEIQLGPAVVYEIGSGIRQGTALMEFLVKRADTRAR